MPSTAVNSEAGSLTSLQLFSKSQRSTQLFLSSPGITNQNTQPGTLIHMGSGHFHACRTISPGHLSSFYFILLIYYSCWLLYRLTQLLG